MGSPGEPPPPDDGPGPGPVRHRAVTADRQFGLLVLHVNRAEHLAATPAQCTRLTSGLPELLAGKDGAG